MWKWQPLPVRSVNGLGMNVASRPALLREGVDHVAEEDGAIAGRQRVRELEVLLELAVGVLVVVRVVAPAELVAVARDGREEVVVARQAAQVVAGLLERVERVGDRDGAVVAAPQQEVLELGPDLELEALLLRPRELVAEDRARVIRPLLALDVHVAREPGEVGLPRHGGEARRVGHRAEVGVVRPLPDLAGGEPREPRALLQQPVEVRARVRASRSAARRGRRTPRRRTRSRARPRAYAPLLNQSRRPRQSTSRMWFTLVSAARRYRLASRARNGAFLHTAGVGGVGVACGPCPPHRTSSTAACSPRSSRRSGPRWSSTRCCVRSCGCSPTRAPSTPASST